MSGRYYGSLGCCAAKAFAQIPELAKCLVYISVYKHGIAVSDILFQIRAFDAIVVREQKKTGSLWRLRYSTTLTSFGCKLFKLTPVTGAENHRILQALSGSSWELCLADRGYATANGIEYVTNAGGYVTARVNRGHIS